MPPSIASNTGSSITPSVATHLGQSTQERGASSSHFGAGAIAGTVIGVIALIALIVTLYLKRKTFLHFCYDNLRQKKERIEPMVETLDSEPVPELEGRGRFELAAELPDTKRVPELA